MPHLVSREVQKKIYKEEKRHNNTGTQFDFEHSANSNDHLEKKLPKTDISSEITKGFCHPWIVNLYHKEQCLSVCLHAQMFGQFLHPHPDLRF